MIFVNKYTLAIFSCLLLVIYLAYYLAINFGELKHSEDSKKIIDTKLPTNNEENYALDISYTFKEQYQMENGETFSKILKKIDLEDKEIQEIINLTKQEINLKKLRVGTRIETLSSIKNGNKFIEEINIYLSKENQINLFRKNNRFEIKSTQVTLYPQLFYEETEIKNSIFESLMNKNIPENIIMEFVQLFSFDIDFQREIRKNDKIKIFYEKFIDKKQNFIKTGPIYFAKISLHNYSYELYRFQNIEEKYVGYFDSKGKSATKALMKTPINGARLSSGFGMRKHPILGYNKKHRGVDFAAPSGTPIMAAGTGHIEFVGTNGGAGKYIRIKHMNGYKTSYSHLNKYASGIKKNIKVKQGQVIGYVGTTGLSTGPHLHYEVIFNGSKINPMKMKLPPGIQLKGNDLDNFFKEKGKIDKKINKIL